MSSEERKDTMNTQPDNANLANNNESDTPPAQPPVDPEYEDFKKIKRVESIITDFENGGGDPVTAEANKALLDLGMREDLKKDPDLATNAKAFDLLKKQYAIMAKDKLQKNSVPADPPQQSASSVNRPDVPNEQSPSNPDRERFSPDKIRKMKTSEIMERFGVDLGTAIQIKAYPPKNDFEVDRR